MRVVNWTARLQVSVPDTEVNESLLWYVTHGLGGILAFTYTEVAFALDLVPEELPAEVLDTVVRGVARELYGDRWSMCYPPEQYDEAIGRHGMELRERVVIVSLDWWETLGRREPVVPQLDAPLWRGTDLSDPTREDHP